MNATPSKARPVELDDVQGLVRFGYRHLTEACFLLLRVRDPAAARAWLAQAPVTSAVSTDPLPDTALHVAFTSEGLRALDVAADVCMEFSAEFFAGMTSDAARARRLGDVGANDPSRWQWGTSERLPHVAVLLYARPGRLADLEREIDAQCAAGFARIERLPTSAEKLEEEPFGFADGISQPDLDWKRERPVRDKDELDYRNDSCLGEFLLGYPNEYGLYTPRPLLAPQHDLNGLLPRAEDAPEQADLGRNGSYLVMRQLRQDVQGFWRELDGQAEGNADLRDRFAEKMVGRNKKGESLEPLSESCAGGKSTQKSKLNQFTYQHDPQGLRCPLGAHIRRANPRNADLPPGERGIFSRLWRMLGFDAAALEQDLVASTRFHRLLRRGRKYGAEAAVSTAQSVARHGIRGPFHLPGSQYQAPVRVRAKRVAGRDQICWIDGRERSTARHTGLPDSGGFPADGFSIPQSDGPDRRLSGLPQFVTVVGGAYFFLPGIRALRYLATRAERLQRDRDAKERVGFDDEPPGAACQHRLGTPELDQRYLRCVCCSCERRIDPWLRPTFDAVLRDPIARLTTALINWRRPNEGLKIAEEREQPDEDASLQSIIDTFRAQMRGLWKPGGFERGGNTKTHGIVRAEFIVHDGLPPQFRHGIYAQPKTYRAWVRFSGTRTLRDAGHRRRGLHEHQHQADGCSGRRS